MTPTKPKDEILGMLLVDLGGICKKLAGKPGVPQEVRMRARQLAQEFDTLVPYSGIAAPAQHAQGEELLFKITRFLPSALHG